MHRSEIKLADYNPRSIDDWARQKLKNEIKEHGLVNKLVWNEKTGNLVSGHQRLSILDELEGGTGYDLEVDCVSLSPKAEKRVNVFLNNKSAQGTYDSDKLAELIKSDISIEGMGFDLMELQVEYGDDDAWQGIFPSEEEDEEVEEAISDLGTAAELRPEPPKKTLESGEAIKDPERHQAVIDERNQARERMAAVNDAGDTEIYATVVFGCREDREAFMESLGQDGDEKYVDGRKLMFKLNIEPSKTEAYA